MPPSSIRPAIASSFMQARIADCVDYPRDPRVHELVRGMNRKTCETVNASSAEAIMNRTKSLVHPDAARVDVVAPESADMSDDPNRSSPREAGPLALAGADGVDAIERARHRTALHLFHVPVVGQAGPAQDRLDARGPHIARLHRLDPSQGEHVREVDEPELVLVDLLPGVRVLAAHVVHS